jgi:hypothetical protein
MVKHVAYRTVPFLALLLAACDAADDVRVQELPSLASASAEARLGLPELRGAWRFAGWELPEGDTLGLDAELPGFGILMLQEQKRDSLAGLYVTQGGRAPLVGEVRRDSVVSLVSFPGGGEGRFLVGKVSGDTLWLEMTNLVDAEGWRGNAQVAFVRSQTPVTPFRRVRGAVPPPPPVDSAALAAADSLSLPPAGAVGASGEVTPGLPPVTRPPATTATTPTPTQPAAPTTPRATGTEPSRPPVTRPQVEEEPEPVVETEPEPEPEPVEEEEPPRVLGVPVERDSGGGGQLP